MRIPYEFDFADGTSILDYDRSLTSGIVYRVLDSFENPRRGLIARAPGLMTVSPRSHNAGTVLSPWISTGKNRGAIEAAFNKSGAKTVVSVNLSLVDSLIVDLSSRVGLNPRSHTFRNAAIAHGEVLVLDCIPRFAINVV
jgi:hypothetical protein